MFASLRKIGLALACLTASASAAFASNERWTYVAHGDGDPPAKSEIFAYPIGFKPYSGFALRVTCLQDYERDGVERKKQLTVALEVPNNFPVPDVRPDVFVQGLGKVPDIERRRARVKELAEQKRFRDWGERMRAINAVFAEMDIEFFSMRVEQAEIGGVRSFSPTRRATERYSDARDRRALATMSKTRSLVVETYGNGRRFLVLLFSQDNLEQAAAKLQQDCAK